MRPADRAWIGLAAGVILYDATCGPDEMLSEASARYKQTHPVLWQATIVYLAGHLCHVWPQRCDPLRRLAQAFGR